MTHTTHNEIRVELKYCELCGGLWFRDERSLETRCAPCIVESSKLSSHRGEREPSPARKPPARAEAAWYGPTSDIVSRLQAVACSTDGRRAEVPRRREFEVGGVA